MDWAHDPWTAGQLWSTVNFGRGATVGSPEHGLVSAVLNRELPSWRGEGKWVTAILPVGGTRRQGVRVKPSDEEERLGGGGVWRQGVTGKEKR
jgi:hypothetical protein